MSFWVSNIWGQSGIEADQRQLEGANSGFGFRLLKELAHEQPRANLFLSPYSISSVLQMLSTGARGRTLEELEQVLGTGGSGPGRLNEAYRALDKSISGIQTNVMLNIANALWYRSGANLDRDFAAVNEKFYRAALQGLDFSDPRSAVVMNDWASRNTEGKITTIIQPPIPADTAMIIANAIYFKGTWLNPFDRKQTKPRVFHPGPGSEVQVPMMEQTRAFQYQQGAAFQAVQLPYAGKRLQMHVLLPATNSSLDELVGRMDSQLWHNTILTAYKENRGTVVLPRFGLRYGTELKHTLGTLGLKDAWNSKADFSGISSDPLFLSQVKHQSFVEVNEEGTEAAAVTTGVVALASFQHQPPPFQMLVDRPFLFIIADQLTGSILFVGAILDLGSSAG
jgi:serpin B